MSYFSCPSLLTRGLLGLVLASVAPFALALVSAGVTVTFKGIDATTGGDYRLGQGTHGAYGSCFSVIAQASPRTQLTEVEVGPDFHNANPIQYDNVCSQDMIDDIFAFDENTSGCDKVSGIQADDPIPNREAGLDRAVCITENGLLNNTPASFDFRLYLIGAPHPPFDHSNPSVQYPAYAWSYKEPDLPGTSGHGSNQVFEISEWIAPGEPNASGTDSPPSQFNACLNTTRASTFDNEQFIHDPLSGVLDIQTGGNATVAYYFVTAARACRNQLWTLFADEGNGEQVVASGSVGSFALGKYLVFDVENISSTGVRLRLTTQNDPDVTSCDPVLNGGSVSNAPNSVLSGIFVSGTDACSTSSLGDRVTEDRNGDGMQNCEDTNNNGVLGDAGDIGEECDAGIEDTPVDLFTPGPDGVCGTNDDAGPAASTMTDTNGFYLFTGLDVGEYCVQFSQPPAATFSCADGSDPRFTLRDVGPNGADSDANPVNGFSDVIPLEAGEINRTVDAAFICAAALGDRVWEDTTVNDSQDFSAPGVPSEPGVPNATVTLFDCDGTQVVDDVDGVALTNPQTTDADGLYFFDNLRPGCYQVRFDTPAGFSPVTPNIGDELLDSDSITQPGGFGLTADVPLASGEVNPNVDAGLVRNVVPVSRLGDFAWNDLNADGVQTPDELGIENVKVELLACDVNGDPGTAALRETMTNAAGFYFFEDLLAGNYAVRFVLSSDALNGFRVTKQNAGGDTLDSDIDRTSGTTGCVSLGAPDENLDLDGGFFKPASLGDRVWEDTTRDDQQKPGSPGEPGVEGAIITLFDCDGNEVVTDVDGGAITPVVTDASGMYEFLNLRPDSYTVRFQSPGLGFRFVTPGQGTEDVDSDAEVVVGGDARDSSCITLVSGENNPDIDAGLFQPALSRLGDFAWEDKNLNGLQDAGEPGIEDVAVRLYQCESDGTRVPTSLTTATNSDGFYAFENLLAGDYAVEFVLSSPALVGFRVTALDAGGAAGDAQDSDVEAGGGLTACITLGVEDENLTLDGGFFKPASLGDRVWEDTIRDDKQNDGEPGVPGATVSLFDCSGNPITVDIDGNPIASIVTGDSGSYQFSNLFPGPYQVLFEGPAGFDFVAPGLAPENVDSDAETPASNGRLSACVVLASGENNPDVDAGLFLPTSCDVTVSKTCALIEPVQPTDFSCSDAKPIDELRMISNSQKVITSIAVYSSKFNAGSPQANFMYELAGPIELGEVITANGYAAAGATNDVDWLITFADGSTGISRFHRSCSDANMNGPEDCGLPEGNNKGDEAGLLNIWLFDGMAGDGVSLSCTAAPTLPSVETECTFSTPAAPHCQGKVRAVTFRYAGGDCLITPNGQGGAAECVGSSSASGEPVRIVVSDGGSKVYLDTGTPGTVSIGDIVVATAANAGSNEFGSSSLVEVFSETGTLLQTAEFHTSCSKELNLGDRYGAVEVVGLDTTDGGLASLGADVRFDYLFTNNANAPFSGRAVDSVLGSVIDPLNLDASPNGEVALSRTAFILPGASNEVTGAVTVIADDGSQCGVAEATVRRIPPPPAPVSCGDIKPLTALTMVWNGTQAIDVTMESGERFENVSPQNVITFQEANTGNDVEMSIFLAGTAQLLGTSKFHVSCSDMAMNGSEDCGSNQGNGKSDESGFINSWLLGGMTGESGSFSCDQTIDGLDVVDPFDGGGPGAGGVSGSSVLDLSDRKKAKWELTNSGAADLFISQISLAWPDSNGQLRKIKLDGDEFAKDVFADAPTPPSTLTLTESDFESDSKKRRLDAGDTERLEIEFTEETYFRDQSDFQVIVEFANGDSVVLSPAPVAVTGAATVDLSDGKKLKWDIINGTTGDLVITSVDASWPAAHGTLKKIKFDGGTFMDTEDNTSPSSVPSELPFDGGLGDRDIDGSKTAELLLEFDDEVSGRIQSDFDITVTFSNGDVVTLP